MPDTLGGITVPEAPLSASVFPLVTDFGHGRIHAPRVYEHQFGSANAKITQRFLAGNGAKRFSFRKELSLAERTTLKNWYETRSGPYEGFVYPVPNDDGQTFTNYNVYIENAPLSFQVLESMIMSVGLTFVEIPSDSPTYALDSIQARFPNSALETALLSQVQQIIPLIKIQPKKAGYDAIYVSDRRCTIGAQLYLQRLLDWDGIAQDLGNASDDARFTFGNADRAMTMLANDVDLMRAWIGFSLFHVGTGIRIDLWAGEITDWSADSGPEFSITASDGLHELNLPYPTRRIARSCWKDFNDGASCPAAANGGTNLGTPCDKGFDSGAGCVFHNMQSFFGGIIAKPQGVRTKDNSTGTFGFGRAELTSTSLIADSIYDEVVPEIYTDIPMPVNAKIVAGRDEGDFWTGLAVVGEGPIGGFSTNPLDHQLDGQPPHGPGNLGLRRGHGHDPVQNHDPDNDSDQFSLGQGGAGIQTYGTERAAGTAFIEIRKTDTKGLQISRLSEHSIQTVVTQGLSGWKWTAIGSREVTVLTNPIWIVVNALLRAKGLRFASVDTCELYFDVQAAIDAAAICDLTVDKLVGSGTETQFKFIGILQEGKPLRDWIQEILMNCLGYYTFSAGKLRLGIRVNSSAVEAFTVGNIIFNSLQLAPLKSSFNHLTANFADAEFQFVQNSVSVYDINHAKQVGGAASPLFLKSTMNLSGTSDKSPAARNISTRLREELGGITEAEWTAARNVGIRTTVLALNTEVGQVDSLTHDDMPGGSGEFRVISWKLNKDYSIDIKGRTTTDSMYDLAFGPKPADVTADPVPDEPEFAPADWGYDVTAEGDGVIRIRNLVCATNPLTVYQATFTVHHVDETQEDLAQLQADIDDAVTSFSVLNVDPVPGEYLLLESELVEVQKFDAGTVMAGRGALGSTAAAHSSSASAVSAIGVTIAELNVGAGLTFKPGDLVVQITGGAGLGRVAEYSGTSLILRFPISTLSAGNIISSAPRCFRVQQKTFKLTLQPRFFKSAQRANFVFEIPLPCAGVVAISGVLENTRGFASDPVVTTFTANSPYRLRTHGNDKIILIHSDTPIGAVDNLFEPVTMPGSSSFKDIYAERTTPDGSGPLNPPPSPVSITRGATSGTGTITIGGTVAIGGLIQVTMGSGTEQVFIAVPVWSVTVQTTTTQVASYLTNWLNGNKEFEQYFAANFIANVITITDKVGIKANISTDVAGTLTAVPTGMDSPLEIMVGRRYATSYQDGSGHESELSPFSDMSEPSGGAASLIVEFPASTDVRVTVVRVWALPDGQDTGTPRLVASVTGSDTTAVDTIAEPALSSQTEYPGATQPSAIGAVRVTIRKAGTEWVELRIPPTAARSNVIPGVGAGPVSEATEITADVVNGAGAHQLRVLMR